MKADIFISYQHNDRTQARLIAEVLSKHGYNVWWDIELLPGQKFADEINSIIQSAKAVVVLWTSDSIKSDWVKAETALALEKKILIPIWVEKVNIPAPYNTLHTLDLSQWNGSSEEPMLNSLLDSVAALVGQSTNLTKLLNEQELKSVLEEPRHEAEFWVSISLAAEQSVEAYNLYLEKYGDNGSFSDLAQIKIHSILSQKKTRNYKKAIQALTSLGVAVGIIIGVFQVLQMIEVIPQQKLKQSQEIVSKGDTNSRLKPIKNVPIDIQLVKIQIDSNFNMEDIEFIQLSRETYDDQGQLMHCLGWLDEQIDKTDLTFKPKIGMPCTNKISNGRTVNHVRIYVKYKGLKRFAYLNGDQILNLKGVLPMSAILDGNYLSPQR